jgi:hypothetical protein
MENTQSFQKVFQKDLADYKSHSVNFIAYSLIILVLIYADTYIIDENADFNKFNIISKAQDSLVLGIITILLSGLLAVVLASLHELKYKILTNYIASIFEKYITIIKTGLGIIFVYGIIIKCIIIWEIALMIFIATIALSALKYIKEKNL